MVNIASTVGAGGHGFDLHSYSSYIKDLKEEHIGRVLDLRLRNC